MFRASPYKLQMFRQCPQQYKFCYIDKLAKIYRKPRPYLTMGQNVHDALRIFFAYLSTEERSEERLHEILRDCWRKNREGFKDEQEEREYGTKALNMLSLFCRNNDYKIDPIMVEDFYSASINPGLEISGRIDRVDREKDGTIHVIDYKTGKEPRDVDIFLKEDIQLIAYSFIVNSQMPDRVFRASYLFLESGRLLTIKPDDSLLSEGIKKIIDIVNEIKVEKYFRAKTGPLCRFCDFLEICPEKDFLQPKQKEEIEL